MGSVSPNNTYGFEPNFSFSYSVILDVPVADVFSIIGTSVGHERVTRLSGICFAFVLLKADAVTVPSSVSLADTHVRLASSSEGPPPNASVRHLPRQFFALTETATVLFGLIKTSVHLAGTLTWDEEAKLALYETETTSGISINVWKLRRFEQVEGNRTRVSETIQGRCPFWLKKTVQEQGSSQHMYVFKGFLCSITQLTTFYSAHMESYHTLFE